MWGGEAGRCGAKARQSRDSADARPVQSCVWHFSLLAMGLLGNRTCRQTSFVTKLLRQHAASAVVLVHGQAVACCCLRPLLHMYHNTALNCPCCVAYRAKEVFVCWHAAGMAATPLQHNCTFATLCCSLSRLTCGQPCNPAKPAPVEGPQKTLAAMSLGRAADSPCPASAHQQLAAAYIAADAAPAAGSACVSAAADDVDAEATAAAASAVYERKLGYADYQGTLSEMITAANRTVRQCCYSAGLQIPCAAVAWRAKQLANMFTADRAGSLPGGSSEQ